MITAIIRNKENTLVLGNRQISVYIDTREIMKVAEHNGKFCNIPKHGRK